MDQLPGYSLLLPHIYVIVCTDPVAAWPFWAISYLPLDL